MNRTSKMAACREKPTAKDFKKRMNDSSKLDRGKIRNKKCVLVNDKDDQEIEFNQEDKLICRLYRQVVDDIMSCHKLREMYVDSAIQAMKEEIFQGHKKGFRRFHGIDFCKPVNCCGYLRRYAVCHTGLVKHIMWNFFTHADPCSAFATFEITQRKHLKIITLGGGPGNDLVGFCSALREIPNGVKELDMYIVDVSEGWNVVFPKILRKAKDTDFGSFSHFVKEMKINTGFMAADLTASNMFKNKTLLATLRKVDVVLMVKLTSFLSDTVTADLINVSAFIYFLFFFVYVLKSLKNISGSKIRKKNIYTYNIYCN